MEKEKSYYSLGHKQPTATVALQVEAQFARPIWSAFGSPRHQDMARVHAACGHRGRSMRCDATLADSLAVELSSTWGQTDYDTPAPHHYTRPSKEWPE
jgi:hypothetical protein